MKSLRVFLIGGRNDGLDLSVILPDSYDIPSAVWGDTKEDAEELRKLKDSDIVCVVYQKDGKEIKEEINAKRLFAVDGSGFDVGRDYWSCARGLIHHVNSVGGLLEGLSE